MEKETYDVITILKVPKTTGNQLQHNHQQNVMDWLSYELIVFIIEWSLSIGYGTCLKHFCTVYKVCKLWRHILTRYTLRTNIKQDTVVALSRYHSILVRDFIQCCSEGDLETVETALHSGEIDPSARDDLALQTACHHQQLEIVRVLLNDKRTKLQNIRPITTLMTEKGWRNFEIRTGSRSAFDSTLSYGEKGTKILELFFRHPRMSKALLYNYRQFEDMIEDVSSADAVSTLKVILYDCPVSALPINAVQIAFNTACRYGSIKIVRFLLEEFDPERANYHDPELTHVQFRGLKAFALESRKKDSLTLDPSYQGNHPLRLACESGHIDTVRFMIKNPKIDPYLISEKGKNMESCIMSACRKGHHLVVEALLSHPKVDPSENDNALLKTACRKKKWNVVDVLLTDERVDPSCGSFMPLRQACEQGDIYIVSRVLNHPKILARGKLYNEHCKIQKHSLSRSIMTFIWTHAVNMLNPITKREDDSVKLDLPGDGNSANSQKSNLLNDDDTTTRNRIGEQLEKKSCLDLLHKSMDECIMKGYHDIVVLLLDRGMLDPSGMNNQLIRLASAFGQKSLITKLLLYPSVDPSVNNNECIISAAGKEYLETIKVLLADKRVNPSCMKNEPIKRAASKGDEEEMKLFLAHPKVKETAITDLFLWSCVRRNLPLLRLLLSDNYLIIRTIDKSFLDTLIKLIAVITHDPYQDEIVMELIALRLRLYGQ